MKRPIVFMFSGQGSQYYEMGRELYENYPRFQLWMNQCDEILRPLITTSLVELLYNTEEKTTPFDNVIYTNPALISIQYSLYRSLVETKVNPDYLLGYSLGEITASIAAGSLGLEEALKFVVEYAFLLEREALPAGMLAILDSADLMKRYPDIFEECWIAAENFSRNFVVAGEAASLAKLQSNLHQKDILSQRLPINFGFHTSMISPIKEKFLKLAGRMPFRNPSISTFSALTCEEIQKLDEHHLWNVVRYPVKFSQTVEAIVARKNCIFIDVGPSGTLATFVKYIVPYESPSVALELMNQFGRNILSWQNIQSYLSAETN